VEQAVAAGAQGQKLDASQGSIGTLKNNGVSLAPYHDFDSKIDAGLKSEVDKLKQDIISGKVKVESKSAPTQ